MPLCYAYIYANHGLPHDYNTLYDWHMFEDAYKKLGLSDTARIVDEIKEVSDPLFYDPLEVTIMAAELPFYPEHHLLEISNHMQMPSPKCHVVYKAGFFKILDYTNASIFALNKDVPIQLLGVNVVPYIMFFFRFSKGKHGYFHIVQSVDDINWKDEPPPQARKAISGMIEPVTIQSLGQGKDKGTFYCTAHMVFKNVLAKSDITIKPNGDIVMTNQEILIEDMPILDDLLGQ